MQSFVSSVWQFPKRDVGSAGLYRWYGTVPLDLALRVIDLIPMGDGIVTDLCAGTGTFGEAAVLRGRPASLFDINPVAALVSRCRVAARRGLRPIWDDIAHAIDGSPTGPSLPFDSPYSAKWFEFENLERVRGYLHAAAGLDAGITRDVALLVGLSAVRSIAEVNLACTHHLVRKQKGKVDVQKRLFARLQDVQTIFDEIDVVPHAPPVDVSSASGAETALPAGSSDVVVIHPPYLGVVNYFNVHRLAIDLYLDATTGSSSRASELRRHDLSGDNSIRYTELAKAMFRESARLCSDRGTVVLIQGDHRYRGRLRHPITEQTIYLESIGLMLHERFIWLLEHNAGMHVERKGHHIDHNYVSFFRR